MKEFFQPALLALAMAWLTGSLPGAELLSPIVWRPSIEIASGRGERGPWQQNESRYDYVDDPGVAINNEGVVFVAWVDQARKDVLFERFSAEGSRQLDASVNVSRNPKTFSWLPRVVLIPQSPELVFVLWQEIIFSGGSHGGEIFFARSQDGGNTFSEPINLSNSIGGDGKGRINKKIWDNGSLDLAAGANGLLYAAWTEYDGMLWFSRSTNAGESFSSPWRIAGGGRTLPARAPTLALSAAGTVYLAWTVGEDKAADIRIAKSTDRGLTFSEPQIVARTPGYSDAPKLAVDPKGTLHLVWAESSGEPFERGAIYYTQSADGARTFADVRTLSKPEPDQSESDGFPALSLDGRGGLYVLWELYPNYREPPHGLGLVVSRDGGRTFTAPMLVPGSSDPGGGSNGSHQGLLMKKLAVNDAGAVAIVNSSLKQDEQSRVWLMRGQLKRE